MLSFQTYSALSTFAETDNKGAICVLWDVDISSLTGLRPTNSFHIGQQRTISLDILTKEPPSVCLIGQVA